MRSRPHVLVNYGIITDLRKTIDGLTHIYIITEEIRNAFRDQYFRITTYLDIHVS